MCSFTITANYYQGRKGNPNPNFLIRISSGGVGFFDVKGSGPKSSVCSPKPRETKLFGGISRDFGRDIPEVPEKSEKKKVRVQFSFPITKTSLQTNLFGAITVVQTTKKQLIYKANSFAHVLLQAGTNQWQQHCKKDVLVELFL